MVYLLCYKVQRNNSPALFTHEGFLSIANNCWNSKHDLVMYFRRQDQYAMEIVRLDENITAV